MENFIDKIRADCWDKALDCFGFSYIYSKKIDSLNIWLRLTKVLGIMIPVLLGGLVSSYYSNLSIINWAIIITSPIALAQLIVSTYLTIIGSDEKVNTYSTKAVEYNLLNSEFENLANFPLGDEKEHQNKYNVLLERFRGVSKENHNISDKDLRKGMRAGLRNYKRACVSCKIVPTSMVATKCDICGNF